MWRKRSIDSYISRLRDRGLVRRLKPSHGKEPALYARLQCQTEPLPFEDMTLREVIEKVLDENGATTATELAVTMLELTMLEQGYETTMSSKALRDAIGVILRREKGWPSFADNRWGWAIGIKTGLIGPISAQLTSAVFESYRILWEDAEID